MVYEPLDLLCYILLHAPFGWLQLLRSATRRWGLAAPWPGAVAKGQGMAQGKLLCDGGDDVRWWFAFYIFLHFRIDFWRDCAVLFLLFRCVVLLDIMYVRCVCVSWICFPGATSSSLAHCSHLFTKLPTITIHMRRATHVGVIPALQPWRHPSSFPFDSRWRSSELQQVLKHRVDICRYIIILE